jgi:chromosome segregation ATPase
MLYFTVYAPVYESRPFLLTIIRTLPPSTMPSRSNTSDSSRTTTISAVNNGTSLNNSAPDTDPKQASRVWREFSGVVKRLLKHEDVYSDIERAVNQQHATETKLKTQKESMEAKFQAYTNRIHQLESSKQDQLSDFESRYDKWKDEKTLLKSQLQSVKDGVVATHAREVEDVKKMLRHEKERADSLSKKLEKASAEAELTKHELAISNDRLKEWERYTAPLKDVDFESLLVNYCSMCIFLIY